MRNELRRPKNIKNDCKHAYPILFFILFYFFCRFFTGTISSANTGAFSGVGIGAVTGVLNLKSKPEPHLLCFSHTRVCARAHTHVIEIVNVFIHVICFEY